MYYDREFLKQLDAQKSKTVYARISSLKFDESPIEIIEGRVTQGSISVDGASAVRRTCSLSMIAKDININEFYWGLNTKFKLEIGLANFINPKYPDIIWFKQGTYVITNFSTALATNAYTINIQGKDKMVMLNGEVGGTLNSSVDFGKYEETNDEGITTIKSYPIKDIIRDSVHQYGGEPFYNIVINDIDDEGLELLEYRYDDPMYLIRNSNEDTYFNGTLDGEMECWLADGTKTTIGDTENINYDLLMDTFHNEYTSTVVYFESKRKTPCCIAKIDYGETAGYRTTELTYAGDLIGNIGESLTSILDKIKNMLGEFEYFYDLDGRFIFQKKKVFANTNWFPEVNNEDEFGYVESLAVSSANTYTFSGGELITSFNNAPNLLNLKNDFSVWGVRKSVTGQELPVHLRYAIDEKPIYYKTMGEKNENGDYINQLVFSTEQEMWSWNKQPLPPGLSDDWWEIRDWAEFYKSITGEYPQGQLETYKTETTSLDLMTLFPGGDYFWDANRTDLAIFDIYPDGRLESAEHNPYCGHSYTYFVEQANNRNIYTYFYKPQFPDFSIIQTTCDWREIIYQMALDYRRYNHEDDFEVQIAKNNPDFYPSGQTGYEQYYIDLEGFWRQLYKIKIDEEDIEDFYGNEDEHPGWAKKVYEAPEQLDFWFDFLDNNGELGQFSVKMVGDRPKAVNDTSVKGIYFRETPTIIFTDTDKIDTEERKTGYRYFQARGLENMFSISAQGISAKDKLDELIYNYSYCIENATINIIPVYYLEPNTRIHIHDETTGIDGDYIINKMTIPLVYNGTMSITANKAADRVI